MDGVPGFLATPLTPFPLATLRAGFEAVGADVPNGSNTCTGVAVPERGGSTIGCAVLVAAAVDEVRGAVAPTGGPREGGLELAREMLTLPPAPAPAPAPTPALE